MKSAIVFGILVAFLTNTHAQRSSSKGRDSGPLPIQGEQLPELTAYDEDGEAFSLKQRLKGKHGVIVFGCLT